MQSLTASSVNVTNITIRWDRVDCQERNGHIDSYRLIYYPTIDPYGDRSTVRTILGTRVDNRIFSANGLPPRTNYTFKVQASNPNIDVRGPPASYTANTTAPQGKSMPTMIITYIKFSIQTLVFSWMVSSIITTVL